MSYVFPDTVNVIPIIFEEGTKAQTEGAAVESKAYVENYDTIRYDSSGNEYRPDTLIGLPRGTAVKIGDKIQVTLLKGDTVTRPKREVKEVHYAGAFKVSQIEVYLA